MAKRTFITVVVALVASAALFIGSYQLAMRLCATHMNRSAGDLDWLRQEFRLSDAELGRIRKLHAGYLPQCARMCEQIAAKKRELETALVGATKVTATSEQKLSELGVLRTQCQAQMLRHFAEVAQAMPPEQGQRYFAEMQRYTLGFHEQVEQSMSESAGHDHGHN